MIMAATAIRDAADQTGPRMSPKTKMSSSFMAMKNRVTMSAGPAVFLEGVLVICDHTSVGARQHPGPLAPSTTWLRRRHLLCVVEEVGPPLAVLCDYGRLVAIGFGSPGPAGLAGQARYRSNAGTSRAGSRGDVVAQRGGGGCVASVAPGRGGVKPGRMLSRSASYIIPYGVKGRGGKGR